MAHPTKARDNTADFSRREHSASFEASGPARWRAGTFMSFAGTLSMVTAYVVFAFVAAVVLGVF